MIVHGTPQFTANAGYLGTAVATPTAYLDTGFTANFSGTLFQQNSAHISLWSFTDLQSASTSVGIPIGHVNSTNYGVYFIPWYNDGNTYYMTNTLTSAQGVALIGPPGHSIGSWVNNRNAINLSTLFRNGAALSPTTAQNNSQTGTPSGPIYVLAYNSPGPATPSGGAALQISEVSLGSSLNVNTCVGSTNCVSSLGSTPVTPANAPTATGFVPRVCTFLANAAIHGSC
jgi:hypothetical protein